MQPGTYRRAMRGGLAGFTALVMAGAVFSVPASADEAVNNERASDAMMKSLSAIPVVQGPIPEDATTHMFSSMKRAIVPFDVADYGYVEEEYFLSGTTNVYDEVDGSVAVVTESVPYVNRIIVRRPANPAKSSGVVDVEILNASDGYANEAIWRHVWKDSMEAGDTYIGIGSKPNQNNALKVYDPVRYAPISWNEEGQAWDIIAQMGALLKSDEAGRILGGQVPKTVLLSGASQSGAYIATYTLKIAGLAEQANGQSVYDGYLNWVGLNGRSLKQGGKGLPAADPVLSVPYILVDSEIILDRRGARPLPPNQRVWAVPGTPHADLLSPVIPSDEEVYKTGVTPNLNVHKPEFLATISHYPLTPTLLAATAALVKWDQEGIPAAPSLWQDTNAAGAVVRDEAGNVTGGVRSGLIDHPLGQYLGTDGGFFSVHGVMNLMPLEAFVDKYDTRAKYLALMAEVDAHQILAGYLTPAGEAKYIEVANYMMDRIGVAKTPIDAPSAPVWTDECGVNNNGSFSGFSDTDRYTWKVTTLNGKVEIVVTARDGYAFPAGATTTWVAVQDNSRCAASIAATTAPQTCNATGASVPGSLSLDHAGILSAHVYVGEQAGTKAADLSALAAGKYLIIATAEEGHAFATVPEEWTASPTKDADGNTVRISRIVEVGATKCSTPPVTIPPTVSYPAAIYTTPGYHDYNGRHWFTTCEPYSVTQRCRTLIQATTVTQVNGKFVNKQGWAFNNLTYLPSKKSAWRGNPLATTGSWTAADGRQWRTECNTPATGGNGCRSYATAKVIDNIAKPGQPVRYGWLTKEIFNNIVMFS